LLQAVAGVFPDWARLGLAVDDGLSAVHWWEKPTPKARATVESADGDVVTKALACVRQEVEAGRHDEAVKRLDGRSRNRRGGHRPTPFGRSPCLRKASTYGRLGDSAGRQLTSNTLYFALFHALGHGQTLGKRAMGIAVRSVAGTGIGIGRALGRAYFMFFLYLLGGLGLLIDGISPLWDRRNQALHDKVVDTVVIRTHVSPRDADAD
jgi:hypothetical protein